jgi:hypothetical protein
MPLTQWEPIYARHWSSALESGYGIESPYEYVVLAENTKTYSMYGYVSLIKQMHAATADAPVYHDYWLGWSNSVDYKPKTPNGSLMNQWFSPKMIAGKPDDYLNFMCSLNTSGGRFGGTVSASKSTSYGPENLT